MFYKSSPTYIQSNKVTTSAILVFIFSRKTNKESTGTAARALFVELSVIVYQDLLNEVFMVTTLEKTSKGTVTISPKQTSTLELLVSLKNKLLLALRRTFSENHLCLFFHIGLVGSL